MKRLILVFLFLILITSCVPSVPETDYYAIHDKLSVTYYTTDFWTCGVIQTIETDNGFLYVVLCSNPNSYIIRITNLFEQVILTK